MLPLSLLFAVFLIYLLGWYLPSLIVKSPKHPGSHNFVSSPGYRLLKVRSADDLALAVHCFSAERARLTLVILHGNGGNAFGYAGYPERLLPLGINVVIPDLRAHGMSEGMYTTFGTREVGDLRMTLDQLPTGFTDLPLVLFGHSMGGSIAVQYLREQMRARSRGPGFRRAIVESAFSDLEVVIRHYTLLKLGFSPPDWFVRFLLWRAGRLANFDPLSIRPVNDLSAIDLPLLFIHGLADRRIALFHAEHLAAAAPNAELYLTEGGTHDDPAAGVGEAYWKRLTAFVQAAV